MGLSGTLWHGQDMHDTTPSVPAMAVSTVMTSLSISFQLIFMVCLGVRVNNFV